MTNEFEHRSSQMLQAAGWQNSNTGWSHLEKPGFISAYGYQERGDENGWRHVVRGKIIASGSTLSELSKHLGLAE